MKEAEAPSISELMKDNERWYIVIIHSLPIESWVVEDDTIAERDRVALGLSGPGVSWVRSAIGDPRFE